MTLQQSYEMARATALSLALQRRERWDRGTLDQFCDAGARAIAAHAVARSPFYRRLYRGIDLDSPGVLERLPVVTKPELAENWDDVVTDRRLRVQQVRQAAPGAAELHLGRWHLLRTGGTTAEPLDVPYSRRDWRHVLSTYGRGALLMGFPPRLPRLRVATMWSPSPVHMSGRMAATGRSPVYRRLALPVTAPLDELVTQLEQFRPDVLGAYPSIAGLLAAEQLAGRLSIAPRVTFTTSEQLLPEVAQRIEDAWGHRPHNTYATTETGPVAMECDRHTGMHVFEDQTVLESVDDEGRRVPDGELGARVVATNLWSRTFPFLRYEIRDRIALTRQPCPCGRPSARIVAVSGRSDDVLRLPSCTGGTVDVLSDHLLHALDRVPGVRTFQVTWDGCVLDTAVVANPGVEVEHATRQAIAEALAPLSAAIPDIVVRLVDDVVRHPGSGKVKQVHDLTSEGDPLA